MDTLSPHDVKLKSREDAALVCSTMRDILRNFGRVAVNDYYELVGLPTHPSNVFVGWTNLDGMYISQTTEHYMIVLPPTTPID